jgi:protein TonB
LPSSINDLKLKNMKRYVNNTPGFDEIIFENRNKSYGAYDLRKRYNSVTSLSILIGIFIAAGLLISLSFTTKDEVTKVRPVNGSITVISGYIPSEPKVPVVPKMPEGLERVFHNLRPVVTDDTSGLTEYIPTVEEININTGNRGVNDTVPGIVINIEQVIPDEQEPVTFVEEMPQFPGGDQALLKAIADNTRYPEEAIVNNIQGKVVIKFVVNSDGSVSRIEVLRGVDPLLDREAIRVVGTLSGFKPGRQNGVAVPVWFSIPVCFQLRMN